MLSGKAKKGRKEIASDDENGMGVYIIIYTCLYQGGGACV